MRKDTFQPSFLSAKWVRIKCTQYRVPFFFSLAISCHCNVRVSDSLSFCSVKAAGVNPFRSLAQSRSSNDAFRSPSLQRYERNRCCEGRRHHGVFFSGSDGDSEGIESDDLLGAWIPVGSSSALEGLTPTRIEIMGQMYVVWHDHDDKGDNGKTWSVMLDSCPHRMAPLSQGRVDTATGCIECPYHGWQFGTDGMLHRIPQWDSHTHKTTPPGSSNASQAVSAADFDTFKSSNDKLHAKSLPVHLAGDLIFTFIPSSVHGEMFPRHVLPEQMFPILKEQIASNVTYFVRDLPYSADFLVENFMDPAHVPFAHHTLQGTRDDARHIPMKVNVMNFTHVEVGWVDITAGKPRDGAIGFQRPTNYYSRSRLGNGPYRSSFVHVVPVHAGRCRIIFRSLTRKKMPTWRAHAVFNQFVNTDSWLHDAERRAREKKKLERSELCVAATSSDLGVEAFRKWWRLHGFAESPPNTFGPASIEQLGPEPLSRRQQIDPWEYHTKHCSKCRATIQKWKRIQVGALVGSFACAAGSIQNFPLLSAALAMGGLFAHLRSKKIITAIEGDRYPGDVGDRSIAHMRD